jgi:hypothetical protein
MRVHKNGLSDRARRLALLSLRGLASEAEWAEVQAWCPTPRAGHVSRRAQRLRRALVRECELLGDAGYQGHALDCLSLFTTGRDLARAAGQLRGLRRRPIEADWGCDQAPGLSFPGPIAREAS